MNDATSRCPAFIEIFKVLFLRRSSQAPFLLFVSSCFLLWIEKYIHTADVSRSHPRDRVSFLPLSVYPRDQSRRFERSFVTDNVQLFAYISWKDERSGSMPR